MESDDGKKRSRKAALIRHAKEEMTNLLGRSKPLTAKQKLRLIKLQEIIHDVENGRWE